MRFGVRACLLLPVASVAWSRAGDNVEARITAPPILRRDDPIGDRTDFIGYTFGYDNTYTPDFCYGSVTTYSNYLNCCDGEDYCAFPIGCNGTAIIEKIFETGTRSRTQTAPCGGFGPVTCLRALVYQNSGDSDGLTEYYCGGGAILNHIVPTYYRTLTANAPVWTTTPSDSWSPLSTPSSTPTSKTSTPTSTGPNTSISQPTDASDTKSSTSSDETSTNNSESQTISRPSTSSPSISNTPSTQPQTSNSTKDASSSAASHTEKIAIGIGVGLGVPILLLALLAWLIPHPLQRLKSRISPATAPVSAQTAEKPELSGGERVQLDNTQWVPEMATQRQWNPRLESGGVGVPGELEGETRRETRGELYGS